MNQNQTVDDDLQKAIDDITNTTNIDPVFSDPVAAPSSLPEGDTGELDESVGPFTEPNPEMPEPESAPVAPLEPPVDAPDLGAPVAPPLPPEPTAAPEPAPVPEPELTPAPAPEAIPAAEPVPVPEPTMERTEIEPIPHAPDMAQIKQAALRDLIPILGQMNISPVQKFNIYRDTFEELRDYSILEPAYQAARQIPDENTRAEALLFLVESIDKM